MSSSIIKKSNSKESQSILLFIYTNKTAVDCEDEVVKWFLKCITPLSESICKTNYQCDFNVISNIEDNDYKDEENKTINNKIIIALQNGQYDGPMYSRILDKDNLIIIDEKSTSNNLKADNILKLLDNEPECITKIGISAVSNKCMSQYWEEMISKIPNTLDIAGKGYMIHPMWKYNCSEWYNIREKSFNFGWENYNPKLNN